MHPSEEIYLMKSNKLKGKRIGLGITGSVAAVRCVELIRELIRHGAEVIPIVTAEALKLITVEAIEFACGRPPITAITGDVEHVRYCGTSHDPIDILLVAPCSANTISKIALGIGDTTVSLFALTSLGNAIPIILMPAMHRCMLENPMVKANMVKCREMGVAIIDSIVCQGKAKIANTDFAVEFVLRSLGRSDLVGKKVLIIAGGTSEPLDDVRSITNKSSGQTGCALSSLAFERGADVELWYGKHAHASPPYIRSRHFEGVDDLLALVEHNDLSHFDIIINCAAISDYTVKRHPGKMSSGQKGLSIELVPTPKVLGEIRSRAPESLIVGFKLESNITDDELVMRARNRLEQLLLDLMVANRLEDVSDDSAKVFILSRDTKHVTSGTKSENASVIFDHILLTLKAGSS